MNEHLFFKSYIGFCLLYYIILFTGQEAISELVKPIPIVFLLLAVNFYYTFPSKNSLLKALSFSWLGTIILLFSKKNELFFSGGLLAFLLSHIMYIVLFNQQLKLQNKKNSAVYWVGVTGIIIYLLTVLIIVLPNIEDLKFPFFIYAITNSVLLLFAFKGFLFWKKPYCNYILIGSILLVTSDTLLLFNTFYIPIHLSNILISFSYLISQYLIVIGVLKLNQKKQHSLF